MTFVELMELVSIIVYDSYAQIDHFNINIESICLSLSVFLVPGDRLSFIQ